MTSPLFLSYSACYPSKFEDFVEFAHLRGFSGVEFIPDLAPNLPEQIDEQRIQALLDMKTQYQLRYTVHNIFMDINITSLVPKVRTLALEITRDILVFAKRVEAEYVVIHPGYRFNAWRAKPEQAKMFEEIQIETYIELARNSQEIGIPMLIENGNYFLSARNGKRYPLHTGIEPDELLAIARIPPNNPFGICFDIGKAYLSGTKGTLDELLEYVRMISPLLHEVHLNDFDGHQDVLPDLLSYLASIDFGGPIVFECSKDSIDYLLNETN